MLAPLAGRLLVTQNFASLKGGPGEAYHVSHDGVEYWCAGHPGVDLDAPIGTPVYAMKGGTIAYPQDSYSPYLGLYAVVTLPSGEQHWYAHLSARVAPDGATVGPGQHIADSGNSGNSTGAHLHTAVRPPHPNYAVFDGFIEFLSHLNTDAYLRLDLSLV